MSPPKRPGDIEVKARPNMGELEERSWSNMFPDLLESISYRLSLQDYLVFCCVCRDWRFAPSYRSDVIYFRKNEPWYMFYGFDNNDTDKCYFYSFSHPKCCLVRVPHLQGATCVDSKAGWLLAKRNRLFFFCNPFSGTKIDLPEYPQEEAAEQLYAFSSLPSSPKCTAFIISRRNDLTLEISTCRVGDKEWNILELPESKAELGTIRFAKHVSETTLSEEKHLNCIHVWGSKMGLTIHISENTYSVWQLFGNDATGFFKDLKALHYVDWLKKFGENGISISSCTFQQMSCDYPNYTYCNYEIPVDGRATTEQNSLKAVWIEPRFARDNSVEDKRTVQGSS